MEGMGCDGVGVAEMGRRQCQQTHDALLYVIAMADMTSLPPRPSGSQNNTVSNCLFEDISGTAVCECVSVCMCGCVHVCMSECRPFYIRAAKLSKHLLLTDTIC